MSVTINSMDLKLVDTLFPDQLMLEDLIEFQGEIVEVIGIESDSDGTNYYIAYQDDYGDKDVAEFKFDESISLFMYLDEDE